MLCSMIYTETCQEVWKERFYVIIDLVEEYFLIVMEIDVLDNSFLCHRDQFKLISERRVAAKRRGPC